MSITTTTTLISRKWLERKHKHELASIILANIDRIDLFADPPYPEPPAPRIPPDLASALREWRDSQQIRQFAWDRSEKLAAAIDAARKDGWL